MITILRKIIQNFHNAESFDLALKMLVKDIKFAMETQVCSLYLVDKERGDFVLRATEGLRKSSVGKARLSAGQGLVGLVASRAEPVNLEDAFRHPSFQFIEGIGEERYSAFLGVPLIHQKKVLGVLVVQQKKARRFDTEEEAFLVTLSVQLAAEVAHADATDSLVQKKPLTHTRLKETVFTGIKGSSGVAIGKARVVFPKADLYAVPERFIESTQVEAELNLFYGVLEGVREDILALQKKLSSVLPKQEQALFNVYIDILADNALGGEISDSIREGRWAQGAVKEVVQRHVRAFEKMEDPYMSERAVDFRDLGIRLLDRLQGSASSDVIDEPCILVGEEITTSQMLEISPEFLKGIISVTGSSNSHMAIVARALNVPTVVGAVDLPYDRLHGRQVIVDGSQARVICDPGRELKKYYQQIINEEASIQADLDKLLDEPCVTKDGHQLALWVNTGLTVDLSRSLQAGAEGVGLYRTELPFMTRDRFPSEREQIEIYREQLQAVNPKAFTMRTLDIGGDKALPYFPIEEENPFLGWRGIRISLDHPELLLAQVRAMLIASEGMSNLRILLPMITNVSEVDASVALIKRAYREVRDEGCKIVMPPIGVMIEVPAAAYQARALAERVDFVSVGSNDLTQYLLAVDRNNPRVADLYESFHPALLNALRYIVVEVKRARKHVSICGELAGDPRAAVLLMAMGFDGLSMSASQLLRVKYVIRHLTFAQCDTLLKEVLSIDSGKGVLEHLGKFFKKAKLTHLLR